MVGLWFAGVCVVVLGLWFGSGLGEVLGLGLSSSKQNSLENNKKPLLSNFRLFSLVRRDNFIITSL